MALMRNASIQRKLTFVIVCTSLARAEPRVPEL